MKQKLRLLLLSFTCLAIFDIKGQTDSLLKSRVDSLIFLDSNAFESNSVFWKIIAQREKAIPYLIEKIDDTTLTKAAHKCKKTNLRAGDLAYLALGHIIPLPIGAMTGGRFDQIQDGCQLGVFEYIERNRPLFKEQVQSWYANNYKNFKWAKYADIELTDCYRKNKIEGGYRIKRYRKIKVYERK